MGNVESICLAKIKGDSKQVKKGQVFEADPAYGHELLKKYPKIFKEVKTEAKKVAAPVKTKA